MIDEKRAELKGKSSNLEVQTPENGTSNSELEKALPNSLSPEEKRGAIAGGEGNAQATAILGSIHSANEAARARGEGLQQRGLKDYEAGKLKEFAEENGLMLPDEYGAPHANGFEQDVYFNPDDQSVTKINPNTTHDTWNELFQRIAIHNALFPDVAYTLKGFIERDGQLNAVFDQPLVVKGDAPTSAEVRDEMAKRGFEPTKDKFTFENKETGVKVSDLHGANVIKDHKGDIRFIDPMISKKEPIRDENISSPKTESNEKAKETEGRQGDVLEPNEGGEGKETPKEEPAPPPTPEEGPKVGIAHDVKKEREKEAGVQAPERGKGLSAEEGVQRGRQLLKDGADPEQTMKDYEKDQLISADRVSIARARLEQLAKDTQAAIKKFGAHSKQADAARKVESDWAARIQPMQAEWSEIGRRQQGATDIETGSFTGFEKSFEKATDRPMTEEEKKTAQELIDKVAELTERQGQLEAKVKEMLKGPTPEEKEQQSIKDKAKRTAQKIREKAKLNRPGMFMAASPASLVWDGAVEIVASTIQAGGVIADAVQRGIEHIKASDWYKGLSAGGKQKAIDQFAEFHKEEPEALTTEEKKDQEIRKRVGRFATGDCKTKISKV